jgi:hypothetical protein
LSGSESHHTVGKTPLELVEFGTSRLVQEPDRYIFSVHVLNLAFTSQPPSSSGDYHMALTAMSS